MRDFYFEGQWRMDWGFGNPNTTGAFIATLMVAVWIFAFWGRWGFWLSLACNTGLGVCLIHTFSRGALVGLVVGMLPVLLAIRSWRPTRIVAVAVLVLGSAGYAWQLGAAKRYGKGIIEEDKSVSNRWLIYRVVPSMMRDAPEGWGVGRASEAYRQWYQPSGRLEKYKYLVSSHATWLVELGWLGRLGYVAGWAAVLLLSWPTGAHRCLSAPLGVWLCFGTAAAFSDIAHEKWVWAAPAIMLAGVLLYRLWKRHGVRPLPVACWMGGSVAAIVSATFLASGLVPTPVAVKLENGIVFLGNRQTQPDVFVAAPDQRVMGEFYGHRIRESLLQKRSGTSPSGATSVAVAWRQGGPVPTVSSKVWILAGEAVSSANLVAFPDSGDPGMVVLLNPTEPNANLVEKLPEIRSMHVLFGDQFAGVSRYAWQALAMTHPRIILSDIPMAATFVPDWMTVLPESSVGETSEILPNPPKV